MDSREKFEMLRIAEKNRRLERLLKKHNEYKERIRRFQKKKILNTSDQFMLRELKLKKLKSKDEMTRLYHLAKPAIVTSPERKPA